MTRTRLKAADLFCGAGGFTTGALQAGVDVVLAVNHWRTAIYTHESNHPETRHICARISDIDIKHDRTLPDLDMILASPECFVAGTLVLTDRGPKPIEETAVGDVVLTHMNRWRRVTATMVNVKDTVVVRGHGHFGIETTADHPFYSCDELKQWCQTTRTYRRHLTKPRWVSAHSLMDAFWATPTDAERIDIPPLPNYFPGFWWMVGRWLADGTCDLRDKGGSVSIACGHAKLAELQKRLPDWTTRQVRTANLVETRCRDLAEWLVKHFGKLAHGKLIPGWALAMPKVNRQELLDGYLSGDGSQNARTWDCVTVSKALAIGVRLLAESLGHRASLHFVPARPAVIEGREVRTRDQYRVKWVKNPKKRYAIQEGDLAWSRVAAVEEGRKGVAVYNLAVEEDESFVADGLVVHNCTHHSIARGGRPICDQRRSTPWNVLDWVEAKLPRWLIVENVREFRDWGPIDEKGRPIKSRRGEIFRQWVASLEAYGYQVDHQILNAADFGAATSRNRLFIVGRRGRRKADIPWPEITHPRSNWRPAYEIIDWARPCPSIFDRKRPLAEKTLARIEIGLRKFVGEAAEPFLVRLRNNCDANSVGRPLGTITTSGAHDALAVPFQLKAMGRCPGLTRPITDTVPTIVAARENHAVVVPFVTQFHNGPDGANRNYPVYDPLKTLDCQNRYGLVAPYLLAINHGGDDDRSKSAQEPMATLTTKTGHSLVLPFIAKYYGTGSVQPVTDPLDTITTKDRFGLAMASLIQTMRELHVVDIGFRMLDVDELAAAQGFPDGYQLFGSKADRVRQIGNSVSPPVARALCQCYAEAS